MPDALDLAQQNPNPSPTQVPVTAQPTTPVDAPVDQNQVQGAKPLPTVSELRTQMGQKLPTVSELKQQVLDSQPKTAGDIFDHYISPIKNLFSGDTSVSHPFTGQVADTVFGTGPMGKIMQAAGQSAADTWGAMKGVSSQELYKSMDPEDAKKDQEIVKGANEAWFRPLIYKILAQEAANAANITENLVKPIFAGGAGLIGAASAVGEQLESAVGKNPVSELARGLGTGAGGDILPEIGHLTEAAKEGTRPTTGPSAPDLRIPTDPVTKFNEARAKGVIGPDGEKGFFGTTPVTPEEAQARAQAAQEAGLPEVPEPTKTVPTIQELARQVNPDAFKEWDKLSDLQENLRASLQYVVGRESGTSESAIGLRQRIQETDLQLRDLIPETSDARKRVEEMLDAQTPTGDQYRDYVQVQALEAALRMQELERPVQEATDHARSLLPDEPTGSTGEPGKPASEAPKPSSGESKSSASNGTRTVEGNSGSATGSGRSGSSPEGSLVGNNGLKELSEGETATAGGSKRLLQDAVLRGMGDEEEAATDLPEYVKFNAKEQMTKAADLVTNHLDEALDILDGNKPSAPDLHEQFVLRALKSLADETENAGLARRIRKSPLNKQVSLAGQTLAARSGLYGVDATSLLEHVENLKRKTAGGFRKADAAIKATADAIEKSVSESIDKFKDDVESFAKSIQCDT